MEAVSPITGDSFMQSDRQAKRKLAILLAIRDASRPLSSTKIVESLVDSGYDLSERTVRNYLTELDDEGLTENQGKRGRSITAAGLAELAAAGFLEKVAFLSAKIDRLTYRMGFDLPTRTGTVVVNTSVVRPKDLTAAWGEMAQVFAKGYAMGRLVSLLQPGEQVGATTIPPGYVGFCTVCSITVNGVLLKHGVPMRSRFGGLLELRGGVPTRFNEMILYEATTIDPLEAFIRSGMTDYRGAVKTGNGLIGASFREMPTESRDLVISVSDQLARIGLGALLTVGRPGRPLFDVPVTEGRVGAIVIGGLNPIAILEEKGTRVASYALSGLLEYNRLFPYTEVPERLRYSSATTES
jgi:repressor of nif and glnA expression